MVQAIPVRVPLQYLQVEPGSVLLQALLLQEVIAETIHQEVPVLLTIIRPEAAVLVLPVVILQEAVVLDPLHPEVIHPEVVAPVLPVAEVILQVEEVVPVLQEVAIPVEVVPVVEEEGRIY